jgi:hypothetical protein
MPVLELPVRAQTRQRVRNRLPAVIVLWSVSVLAVGWVASATKLGPIVHRFNGYHGIHLADVLLAAIVTAGAGVGTWLLLRSGRDADLDQGELDVVAIELRRLPLILALWVAVTIASVWVAFETEVGPVLFEYNNHRAVRVGDLAFTFAAIAAAAWLTVLLLRPRARDRHRS